MPMMYLTEAYTSLRKEMWGEEMALVHSKGSRQLQLGLAEKKKKKIPRIWVYQQLSSET